MILLSHGSGPRRTAGRHRGAARRRFWPPVPMPPRPRAERSDAQALIADLRLEIEKLRRSLFGQSSERAAACSIRWNCSWKSWRARRPRMNCAPNRPPRRPRVFAAFTPQAAGAQAVPDASAARAGGRAGADDLRLLWRHASGQARRGRDRDAGSHSAAVEGDPARAREVHLPRLRDASARPPAPFHVIAARLGRSQPAGDDRCSRSSASTSRSTARPSVTPGKACRSACRPWPTRSAPARGADAAVSSASRRMSSPPSGCTATIPPCRCWPSGKTDTGRLWVYVRDDRPFGGRAPPAAVFYYSRDRGGGHPQGHLADYAGILQADAYERLRQALRGGPQAGPDHGSACWATRDASSSSSPTSPKRAPQGAGQDASLRLAVGAGGGAAHRRAVRHRARRSTAERRGAPGRAAGAQRAAGRRPGELDARRTRQALARTTTSPRPWTTCSSAGPPSRAFSKTGGSA